MVRQALRFVIGAVLFALLALVLLIGGILDQRPLVALLGGVMVAISVLFVVLAVRVTKMANQSLSGTAGRSQLS